MKLDLKVFTTLASSPITLDSIYTYKDSLILGNDTIFKGTFKEGQLVATLPIIADVSHYGYLDRDYTLLWGVGLRNYLAHFVTFRRYNEVGVIHYKIEGCDGDNKVTIDFFKP